MFDCHTHILYGVDDGSNSIEESVEIIKALKNLGFKKVMLTPHHIKYSVENSVETLKERFDALTVQIHDLDIEIFLGNEIYLEAGILNDLVEEKCLKMHQGPYILVELPFNSQIQQLEHLLFEFKLKGYHVILAHPERYAFVQEDIHKVKSLIDQGFLMQVNLSSINGGYGKVVEQTAKKIIKKQWLHFVGSDVHRLKGKQLNIEDSLVYLKKNLPSSVYDAVMVHNGNKLLDGQIIENEAYVKPKRKWLKRIIATVLILVVLGASGLYYGYKKLEAQFESAMIQEAKIYQENLAKEAARIKAEEEKLFQEAKAQRENEREAERLARLELQKKEDERIEALKDKIDEEIKAEEAAMEEALKAAEDEAAKEAARKIAEEKKAALEKQKEEALKAQAELERKRLEEEERLKAEAQAEEARLEAERLEKERLAQEEKERLEAEMEAKYTNYETDKAKAMDLALSRLSVDQVNNLIQMASGGFNPEEKAKAKEMFYNNFTQDEQTWILEMYVKYYGG